MLGNHPLCVYKLTVTRNGQFVCGCRGDNREELERLGSALCEKYNADYFKIQIVEDEE